MKTKKQILMLLLALLVGLPTLSAQSKEEKKEQKKEAVTKLIASENYKIDVQTALPMRGRSVPLTSPTHWKSAMIRSSPTYPISDGLTASLMVAGTD